MLATDNTEGNIKQNLRVASLEVLQILRSGFEKFAESYNTRGILDLVWCVHIKYHKFPKVYLNQCFAKCIIIVKTTACIGLKLYLH